MAIVGTFGNDTLVSTASGDILYGDTDATIAAGHGGNDLLIGDGPIMDSTARGGNDRLWGDPQGANAGGADVFLFVGLIGRDLVFDFRPDEGDLLNLLAYDFGDDPGDDIGDLVYSSAGGNTTIDIGASFGLTAPGLNTVRLLGFDDLAGDKFVTI